MKISSTILLFLVIQLFTKNTFAQNTYSLKANIPGSAGPFAYLTHTENDKHPVDSVAVNNQQFELNGAIGAPELCVLSVQGADGKKKSLYFYLQPGTLEIYASFDTLGRAAIKGSPQTLEFRAVTKQLQPFNQQSNALGPLYDEAHKSGDKKKEDSVLAKFDAINAQKWALLKTYLASSPDSYPAVFYAANLVQHVEEAKELYEALGSTVKASYSAVRIKGLIDAGQQTAIGQIAPDFVLKDADGKAVTLASFKGKYVLIDFWASWCAPCRAESPNLLAAYRKNKQKDFVILSVSIDLDKKNWKNAIKQDNMQWPQVIDEGEWKSNIVKQYAVTDLPFNFLLDKDGKIIAKNLRGDSLPDKIASFIK